MLAISPSKIAKMGQRKNCAKIAKMEEKVNNKNMLTSRPQGGKNLLGVTPYVFLTRLSTNFKKSFTISKYDMVQAKSQILMTKWFQNQDANNERLVKCHHSHTN